MHSYFKNLEAKKEFERLYFKKINLLGIPYEMQHIETSFGDTNVITTGSAQKPSLVLLHDSNSCAPVALEMIQRLADHFKIYAIDIPGHPNLSAEVRLNQNDQSYGKWMFEILSRLQIENATLLGISFGGFICLKALVFDEKRIKRTFLIFPDGIIKSNPLKEFWKVCLPIKMYQWKRKAKYLQQYQAALFSEEDLFVFEFLSKVILDYDMDFSQVRIFQKAEISQIKSPIYLVAGENDLNNPGKILIQDARKKFPTLKETLLIKGSKKVPDFDGVQQIIDLVLKNQI
ncbi:MAG: alpha/beta hydrolase [Saprospiraceae bacterium]